MENCRHKVYYVLRSRLTQNLRDVDSYPPPFSRCYKMCGLTAREVNFGMVDGGMEVASMISAEQRTLPPRGQPDRVSPKSCTLGGGALIKL